MHFPFSGASQCSGTDVGEGFDVGRVHGQHLAQARGVLGDEALLPQALDLGGAGVGRPVDGDLFSACPGVLASFFLNRQ